MCAAMRPGGAVWPSSTTSGRKAVATSAGGMARRARDRMGDALC